MKNIKRLIVPAATLTIICVLTALCLSVVNAITKGPIADAEQKARDEAIAKIFPDADSYKQYDLTQWQLDSSGKLSSSVQAVYTIYKDGKTAGAVIEISESSGYGGAITMMVGITGEGTVSSLEIVSHSETAGLGANIEKEEFRSRFKGVYGEAVIGENVDALSGATISSKAVASGVNKALSAYALLYSEAPETSEAYTEEVTEAVTETQTEAASVQDTTEPAEDTTENNETGTETTEQMTGAEDENQ